MLYTENNTDFARYIFHIHQPILTLMLQLGGIFPCRRTFYHVALKLLGIVTKAFVTFPEYMIIFIHQIHGRKHTRNNS